MMGDGLVGRYCEDGGSLRPWGFGGGGRLWGIWEALGNNTHAGTRRIFVLRTPSETHSQAGRIEQGWLARDTMTATGAASGVPVAGLGLDWAAQFEKSHERKRIKFHESRDSGMHESTRGLAAFGWLAARLGRTRSVPPCRICRAFAGHLQGICFALQAFADSERHGQIAPELPVGWGFFSG